MNRKWLIIAGLALLVVGSVALKAMRGDRGKEVEAEHVQLRVLAPSILASGTLVYESEVKLVSEVIGRVKEVAVQEGDQVREGQLLLRLDPATSLAMISRLEAARRQSELNIERQQVTLSTQQAKWQRYQQLRERGIVDVNTYEEIKGQRDLAEVELNTSRTMLVQTEAQLKEAREQLAKTEIRAPMNGKITAISIKAGETAVPSAMSIAGSDLMTIADTASLYAEVNVDETDVARVGVQQTAKITPAAFPDKSWSGTVEQIAISPRQQAGQSKSYPVKIRLAASAEVQFHPGMSCRAEISTRREGATPRLAVPVQAVKYEDNNEDKNAKAKASVFVIAAGKVVKRSVETGIADDAFIEIVRGANENEQIVTGPARTLRFMQDGERVIVSKTPPPATPTKAAGSS